MRKGIKWNKIILIFSFFITSTTHAQLKESTFEEAKITHTADLLYLFTNTPGFTVESVEGDFEGISIDIMPYFEKYVKVKYGIEINSKYQRVKGDDFPKMMQMIKDASGGVFGLGNITITAERKKIFQFSPPFMSNLSLLITHVSAPTLTNIENIGDVFKGMSAVTVKGSTNEMNLLYWKENYFSGMKILYTKSIPKALNVIAIDSTAFTNVDFTYYLQAIEDSKPVKNQIVGASKSEELGIIMPKDNDWASVLTEFVNSGFITSSEYKSIIKTNLGEKALQLLESVE